MTSWTSCFKFMQLLRPGTEQRETSDSMDLDEYRKAEGVLPQVDSSQDVGLLETKESSPEAGSSEEDHNSSEGGSSNVEDLSPEKVKSPELENSPEAERIYFKKEEKPVKKRIKKSLLLKKSYVTNLTACLPKRLVGTKWVNVFDTDMDGFTLCNLYSRFSNFQTEITSSLIVIKDSNNNMFGVFVSAPLKESASTYGNGETFLFTTWPIWTVYVWSGDNEHFVKGSKDSIIVGGSTGNFALWVNSDLDKGRTLACDTFRSGPLANNEDFKIISVECWTFV